MEEEEALPPPEKRRRRTDGRVIKAVPPTLQEQLALINKEISELELNIATNATEFQKVRAAMMTGIASYEGIRAKDKIDTLTAKLNSLRGDREKAVIKMDMAIHEAIKPKEEPKEEGEGNYCKGGCKNLMYDNVSYVDICEDCGAIYDHRLDCTVDNFAFGDVHFDMPRRRGGGYKPPNHFAEILAQFQGKRRSCAPPHIVEMIGNHCKRYHIATHKITPGVVRSILKQKQQEETATYRWAKKKPDKAFCKYTDYYKHTPEIAWKLSGIPPPYMTPSQQDKVIAQFPLAVAAYRTSPRYLMRKSNRNGRKKEEPNVLNYFYMLFKLCQLLGYEEFLPYIPLPKSLANIEDCDQNGWKHICAANHWAYIPTR